MVKFIKHIPYNFKDEDGNTIKGIGNLYELGRGFDILTPYFLFYGTLMSGCRNNRVIANRTTVAVEEFNITGLDFDILHTSMGRVSGSSFPCVYVSENNNPNKVIGELHKVTNESLLAELTVSLNRLESSYPFKEKQIDFYTVHILEVSYKGQIIYVRIYLYASGEAIGGTDLNWKKIEAEYNETKAIKTT